MKGLPRITPPGSRWNPRCPDGYPQRLVRILGFRLKGADYLQLRVVLCRSDHGVCQAIVDESPDRVVVRALACMPEDEEHVVCRDQPMSCPLNLGLDAPLGHRVVIDFDSEKELPLCIPHWDTDEPDEYVPRPPGDLWPPVR